MESFDVVSILVQDKAFQPSADAPVAVPEGVDQNEEIVREDGAYWSGNTSNYGWVVHPIDEFSHQTTEVFITLGWVVDAPMLRTSHLNRVMPILSREVIGVIDCFS